MSHSTGNTLPERPNRLARARWLRPRRRERDRRRYGMTWEEARTFELYG